MLLLVATFFMAFVLLLYMLSPLISPKPLALPGAHVVVSGLWLRRHLPARPAAPSLPPGAPARDPHPAAARLFSKRRVTCGGPYRHCPCGGSGDPPSPTSGSSPARKAGRRRGTAPASLVPALQGLGCRSLIPGASPGCGCFCLQFSR